VDPQFNEPLYNEVLGIMNDILQPDQGYSKMHGTEPRYNQPWYNEILIKMNTIQKPKCSIHTDRMKKCQHMTKDKYETDWPGWKSFNPVTTHELHSNSPL